MKEVRTSAAPLFEGDIDNVKGIGPVSAVGLPEIARETGSRMLFGRIAAEAVSAILR